MDHLEARNNQAVDKYLLGELSPTETEEFELHFFDCSECAEELRMGAIFEENARAVFAGQPRREAGPEPVRPLPKPPWWTQLASAWRQPAFGAPAFAALLLLAVTGYQNLVMIPSLKGRLSRIDTAQAIASVTLHESARGNGTKEIVVPRSDRFFEVWFVSPDHPASTLSCELRDSNGSTVLTSDERGPGPDVLTDLIIPTDKVTPGRWELVIRDASSRAELSRYRFTVRYN